MNDNYDYIHQASNERLAEMLEGKVRGVDALIDHVEGYNIKDKDLKFLYEDKALYEEAARRLRIPPHRTFHEEYFGEV